MAFYRVSFFGTLLVEADNAFRPDLAYHMWTVSMRQATHGVEIQAILPEIKAVEFSGKGNKIDEITQELHESIERDKEAAQKNPGAELIARMFCKQNYYVGLQTAWESLEFERMRPHGVEPDEPPQA
jgi:hypothetical protein